MHTGGGSREQVVGTVMQQLDSAKGKLPELPRAALQNVTTAVAAVTVVLVALTYLVGVAGLVWLVVDYGISHARLLSDQNAGGSVLIYLILAFVALLFVLLLVKPVFQVGLAEGKPHKLRRSEQPELYAYVDRLCDLLKTPKPERIEVFIDANASASQAGFAMGLFSRRPVLSLGLTLVSGVDASRLTGIIAHELAHFTQGRATRFRLIIYAVNAWFARVVFERDRFDYWIARASIVPIVGLALLPVRVVLWLGRVILWVFMLIAHAATGLVSRRGEYEADKFMAAVIGSDQIGKTLQRIAVLNMCLDGTREDLRSAYLAGRLADDVPALASARADGLPEERRNQLMRLIKLQRPAWHSTHPTLAQRSAAARPLLAKPLIVCREPSAALFRDFEALCKAQTREAYDAMLGDEMKTVKLVPTAELIAEIGAAENAVEALGRFYQCQALLTRPMLPLDAALGHNPDRDAMGTQLAEARDQMLKRIKEYDRLATRLIRVEERIRSLEVALALTEAGFQLNPAELRLKGSTASDIRRGLHERHQKERDLHQELADFETVVHQRLTSAVALLQDDEIAEGLGVEQADKQRALMRKVVLASRSIERAMQPMREMNACCEAMVVMLQAAHRAPDGRKLKRVVDQRAADLCRMLESLRGVLGDAAYPFEHADASTSISQYVVSKLPEDKRDYEQVVFAVGEANERYESLVARCMAVSAETAEQVETAAGFAPREAPDLKDEFELFLQDAERSGNIGRDAALSENWLAPLAVAALFLIGVFLGGVGTSSIAPTLTSAIVPHHPQYEPTIVPAAFVDPTQGPRFFDPVRDWRIDNLPTRPTIPGFQSQPAPYRPPGYNNPHDPNTPNGYDPAYPGGDPNRYRPGNPGNQPHRPPGYNNPNDPNRNNNPNRPQPGRPYNPNPGRPSGPGGSPGGPSPPSPGGF